MARRSGNCMRCMVIFSVVSVLVVCGPTLYWKLNKGFVGSARSNSVCPPCDCDCPRPLSLLEIAPGLANLSVTDCGSDDPELKQEMEKQFVDLLTEELKLQEAVADEHSHHMNVTLGEAKRVASQYQKEAEKCNAATEICESARERAQALLIKERKITSLWERRARQLGFEVYPEEFLDGSKARFSHLHTYSSGEHGNCLILKAKIYLSTGQEVTDFCIL
ncbi:unnamed protein product [Arabis nemorensis]|uniref:DUF1068 domain-containing protein n=1 Tax=Arabis nemorensis TaxID=586526 RepID=A0A565BBY4_9BRAS|nr:unnamed protein product [Arabis nemorensis]